MSKTVLILHGWPRRLYYKYFGGWGYDVVAPEIFSRDFVLTSDNAKKYIEKELSGKSPDVIMGISLGGLLAPYIAKNYPNARMILIATGPRLMPESARFKILISLVKNKKILNVLNIVKFLPQRLLFGFYEAINPFSGNVGERLIYIDDTKKNLECIMNIPISKEGEIVDFVTNTDVTDLFKSLKNKTLIFTGENDLLMPKILSEELHKLLLNSQIIVSHGSHSDVISEPSFKEMQKFLSE